MVKINKVYLKGQEEARGYNNPNKIIIHHPEFYGSIQDLNSLMRGMGYYMIGYNFYVRKDGSVWQGRPVEVESANCYGQNNSSIGVCFEGDYEKDKVMPEAQFNAGVELIKYLKEAYNINEVGAHKKYYNTDCPGQYFPISSMLNSISLPLDNSSLPISNLGNLNYKGSDTNGAVTNISSFLNVRETPGGKVIGKLNNNERVKVNLNYKNDKFYSIYFGDNGGFVSKDYIEIDKPKTTGYVVTNYLPNGWNGNGAFNGIDLNYVLQYFKDIKCVAKGNDKGVWIETQELMMDKCLELKKTLGSWFYEIR